ncbi:hypothetical protein SNE40_017829 [Patella caerulea]|uniref:Uncharacterized protein n=1 Tax=Patella caerulea TaxID=87958 RepID=A0AAN8JD08_PATCE
MASCEDEILGALAMLENDNDLPSDVCSQIYGDLRSTNQDLTHSQEEADKLLILYVVSAPHDAELVVSTPYGCLVATCPYESTLASFYSLAHWKGQAKKEYICL